MPEEKRTAEEKARAAQVKARRQQQEKERSAALEEQSTAAESKLLKVKYVGPGKHYEWFGEKGSDTRAYKEIEKGHKMEMTATRFASLKDRFVRV
jgi:hypothetical protein